MKKPWTSVFLHTHTHKFLCSTRQDVYCCHSPGDDQLQFELFDGFSTTIPDDTTANCRVGELKGVGADRALDVGKWKRKMLVKGQESVGGKENKWKWMGGWEGGLLKTKAAEEIERENDGVSLTWKQGVLLLKKCVFNWSSQKHI